MLIQSAFFLPIFSTEVQLELFETANRHLEVPYRTNQKKRESAFAPFTKARKRVETLFSQLCDQFMIIRNYAKDTQGVFTQIIGKNGNKIRNTTMA